MGHANLVCPRRLRMLLELGESLANEVAHDVSGWRLPAPQLLDGAHQRGDEVLAVGGHHPVN